MNNSSTNYRFIIALFGKKHIGMLLTSLYAISQNAPSAKVSVFWQDVSVQIQEEFKLVFPFVDFNQTHFDLASDKIKRISSKMLFWSHAAAKFNGENLCFVDVDTLVVRDIGGFFNEEFDILFTVKEGLFPLNTGVMLAKGNNATLFFERWLVDTVKIISDKQLLAQAVSTKHPFGGGDQMSFYKLVSYKKGVTYYVVKIDNKSIVAISKPCSILNETRSVIVSEDTHIVHYKGGWQDILLEGKDFTKNRPKKHSWEMYIAYLNTHKIALEKFNSFVKNKYIFGEFGIKIPSYLNKENLEENKLKYFFFHMFSYVEKIVALLKK